MQNIAFLARPNVFNEEKNLDNANRCCKVDGADHLLYYNTGWMTREHWENYFW